MNILIAKTILQEYINKNEIALYENDAFLNFDLLCDIASDDDEIIEILDIIEFMNMKHILANVRA